MTVQQYAKGTEYLANELTMTRGTPADITAVGVYHDTDPSVIPDVADFTTVTLVQAGDPLAEAGVALDVLSLIGPKAGADDALVAGTYQRWVLVQTAAEDIIRRPDTIEVL